MDKLRIDLLGEPQVKSVENYAKYIQTIARARQETFYRDSNIDSWQFWDDIDAKAKGILNIIHEAINSDLGF